MVFKTVEFTRKTLFHYLENLTPEQLYFIPKGFKNNIIWNIGHILIVEQLLTYKLSGLEINADKKFIKLYSKGTFPSKKVSLSEIEDLKKNLIPAYKNTKRDYENGTFKNYKEFVTGIGVKLNNIDDALQFIPFHDAIHLGIILSIKKLLK